MTIAKQDFDQLINLATVKLTGASNAGLKAELYDVLTEFCTDSRVWTECIQFAAVPLQRVYGITPTEGQIINLVGVFTADPAANGGGFFQPAIMPEVGTIHLEHAPSTAVTMLATVEKTVVLPTTRDSIPIAPDWLLPLWHVGILDGLLGKMMGQQNKSYTNDTLSVYHLKRFRDAIAQARVRKQRANTKGAQAWRYPFGFSTRSQQGGVPSFGGTDRTFQ